MIDPRQRIIENAIALERLSRAIARDSSGVLRALYEEIVREIVRLDPTAVSASSYRRARIAKLLERIEDLAPDYMADWHKQVRADLALVGKQQADFTVQQLVATLGQGRINTVGPTLNMMKAIIDTNPFAGETLRGWADVQEQGVVRRVRQAVQMGMAREESIDQMVRRVRGRSDGRGNFTDGVMEASERDARNIVRTAVTDIANSAARVTYQANPRVVKQVLIVNTLDRRTCPICMLEGGKRYPADENYPAPPFHMSCRCFTVAVVDWAGLGLKDPEEGTRAARDANDRTIQVPASTDYDGWLRTQPNALQDQILGRRRAELFRSGRMTLAQLIRSDGRFVSVESLQGAA